MNTSQRNQRSLKALYEPFSTCLTNDKDVLFNDMSLNSRDVKLGDIFIALKGLSVDGRDFIDHALSAGAVAVIAETTPTISQTSSVKDSNTIEVEYRNNKPIFWCQNLPSTVGTIAKKCYRTGVDESELNIIGVTGTNGKSSCVTYIAQCQRALGNTSGLVGTLGYGMWGEDSIGTGMTTPDVVMCHRVLRELADSGCTSVAMEVSSHALDQGRVDAIEFNTALLTNITQDHLDYHHTMEKYRQAKGLLFSSPYIQHAVINLDAENTDYFQQQVDPAVSLTTYSLLSTKADYYVSNVEYLQSGIQCRLHSPWGQHSIHFPLFGDFNIENILGALAVCCHQESDLLTLIQFLPTIQPVTGRMQQLAVKGASYLIVIDYAHTPDALQKACQALKKHAASGSQLKLVFGCGGNRDRKKRAIMGSVAERFADDVIVTSDNPRTEDPLDIIGDICEGFSQNFSPVCESDRRQAIYQVLSEAGDQDIILIAGKGHEDYQEINGIKEPFSDSAVVFDWFNADSHERHQYLHKRGQSQC